MLVKRYVSADACTSKCEHWGLMEIHRYRHSFAVTSELLLHRCRTRASVKKQKAQQYARHQN